MANNYHIKKEQSIQGTPNIIYYEGNYKWTTTFSDRKKYMTKAAATSEIYNFGGTIIAE